MRTKTVNQADQGATPTDAPIAGAHGAAPENAPAARTSRLDWWRKQARLDLHLRLSAVLTVALFFLPTDGFSGIELCTFKRLTDLPCPGCGLTRCGANLYRGNVVRAAEYNLFGLVIIPAMAGMGVLALVPRRWRDGARRRSAPYSTGLRRALLVFVIAFVLFGFVRGVGVGAGWWQFPAQWP